MRVHPDLDRARLRAGAWRVLPSERGFYVWRFTDWTEEYGGWRVVVADVRSAVDGWLWVLYLMRLTAEEPPEPLPPVRGGCSSADPEWL